MRTVIPIILSGGTGSRLWPLSRESFPKQFLKLTDEGNYYTLLQQTYKRIEDLENLSKPIIICNEEHRFIVGDQMRKIKTDPLAIILSHQEETLLCKELRLLIKAIQDNIEKNIDPILLILSSDHYIEKVDEFKKSIRESFVSAEAGSLVIFGIMPTYPATGYGYIKAKNNLTKNNCKASKVEKFIEKPNLKTAKSLFEDKKVYLE